ncbi:hypothetical protein CHCC20375_4045 [Bacillus licheniformis]|nr:hypothetical protein CHCC20375_4045 [Bacillus licheniformis]
MKYISFIIQQAAKDHKLPQKKTGALQKSVRFFIRHPRLPVTGADSAFKMIHLVFDLL